MLSRGITATLRIARDIAIRVHPLQIALHRIRREEHPHHWIIIPGVVVVEPGQRIIVLPGEAFGGSHTALLVALAAIGTVDLASENDRTACRVAERFQHTTKCIGQEDVGFRGRAGQFAEEATSKAVVVGATLQGVPAPVVGMFLAAKGVAGERGISTRR